MIEIIREGKEFRRQHLQQRSSYEDQARSPTSGEEDEIEQGRSGKPSVRPN